MDAEVLVRAPLFLISQQITNFALKLTVCLQHHKKEKKI